MSPEQWFKRFRQIAKLARDLQTEAVEKLPVTRASMAALSAFSCVVQLLNMLDECGPPMGEPGEQFVTTATRVAQKEGA